MTNDEEVTILYHKVISVLASCYVLPAEVVTKVAQRLQAESVRHGDRIDKAALGTLAAVLISYIDEDSEETKAKLAINGALAAGKLPLTMTNEAPDDNVWGKDGRLSPGGDE